MRVKHGIEMTRNSFVIGNRKSQNIVYLLNVLPKIPFCSYPRPDNSVYCCGISSEENPPPSADDIEIRPEAIKILKQVVASVNEDLGKSSILKEQACFLPCSDDGLPIIGQIPNLPRGCYIATGHSCWGILLSLATGLGLSEMIVDGKSTSIDLNPFDPARPSVA